MTDLFGSRALTYRLAWVLFVLGVVLPAPSSFYPNGEHASTGLFVIGMAAKWARDYPAGVGTARFAGLCLFVLAFFSNVVFLSSLGVRRIRRVPPSWIALVAASTAVNAAVLVFFPFLARVTGYWLWLAGFGLLTWSLAACPGEQAETAPAKGAIARHFAPDGVPGVLWAWLALTFFWLFVTTINYVEWRRGPGAARVEIEPLTTFVTDPSFALDAGAADRLTAALAAFEKETSNQVALAIYPKAPSSAIDDFTIRTAERSRLGRKGRDNGAVLFVFLAERTARLEVGYGLEGILPDAATHRILDERLAPRLSRSELTTGVEESLGAILDAARAEYRADAQRSPVAQGFRQAKAITSRFFRALWPFLRATTIDARLGISFFGTLLAFGVASGLANFGRLGYDAGRGAWNLVRGRPLRTGLESVAIEPMWDTLKVAILVVALAIACVNVVAGGGAFGGAGSSTRW